MNVYHFDPRTGIFLAQRPARRDPRDPGRYLVPANATTAAPPPTDEEHVAVYDREKGAWTVKDRPSIEKPPAPPEQTTAVMQISLAELRDEIRRVLAEEIKSNEALRREIRNIPSVQVKPRRLEGGK
jgi:hypothetical protein